MKRIINNTIRVKQTNIEIVTSLLKKIGGATISEISRDTGLSIATCGNILKELLKTGEVLEGELLESSGGRPARSYTYNADYSLAICMTIISEADTHNLRCVLVNLKGDVIFETSESYAAINYEVIERFVDDLIEKHIRIKAVGIGIPGVTRGGVVTYCDVKELNGIPLKKMLHEKYNIEVTVENEMHLRVFGYYKNHPELPDSSIAILYAPKEHCMGAGFLIDGKVLKGYTKNAGEIGFLPFGMSKEELLKKQNTEDCFVSIAVNAIASIIAIINPAYLILTGSLFRLPMVEIIKKDLLDVIPEEFLPKIIFEKDLSADYLKGIVELTLDTLSSQIILLEK